MCFFFFFNEKGNKEFTKLFPKLIKGCSDEAMPSQYTKYLRIHGDNIVECERTLELIKNAYEGELILLKSPLYKPRYCLKFDGGCFVIELLSGHDRWGVDVAAVLQNNGGILHEGADSYVTELSQNDEKVIFALEYCSALPAGNNAWQRSGRALSAVLAGVPYLYYAEIGGVELDENREVKAPRFPNPVVPFSYISTTKRYNCCCAPVYKTHPSITESLFQRYKDILGVDQSLLIIKGLINGEDVSEALNELIDRDLKLVKQLAEERRSQDTLRRNQWDGLLNATSPENWLISNTSSLVWQKKAASKVRVSPSYRQLLSTVIGYNCTTIGGKDIPICLLPTNKVTTFENLLHSLYPTLSISLDKTKPLAIVWITGFKPAGDDSRPDRGLAPLARMTLGGAVNMMSIISGPAKVSTWNKLISSIALLCQENGLWQVVFNLCNYVLVDSDTLSAPRYYTQNCSFRQNPASVVFPLAGDPVEFSEDDTDCAIHQIFAHKSDLGVLEGMCNPPGGDWSGISCYSQQGVYRWTSLPRVSQIGGKRPDHVIQIAKRGLNVFLSIESKGLGADLENEIGDHLRDYLSDLFKTLPTAQRKIGKEWRSMGSEVPVLDPYRIVSVGAFMYKNNAELETHRVRGKLDAVMAFELGSMSVVHIIDKSPQKIVEDVLKQCEKVMSGFKVQVH